LSHSELTLVVEERPLFYWPNSEKSLTPNWWGWGSEFQESYLGIGLNFRASGCAAL